MRGLGELRRRLAAAADVVRRRAVTEALFFDAQSYRAENEDVAASVDDGLVRSPYDHYVRYGKWEGRRFALRSWGLDEADARRLFRRAAAWEHRLDDAVSRVTLGELGHALRDPHGDVVRKPIGPLDRKLEAGPWRVPLPAWARRGGWFMLRLQVAPVRAPIALRSLDAEGEPIGEAAALFCKARRHVQRVLRLPEGATHLELELLDQRLRTVPWRLRLRPIPDGKVDERLLRRVLHHHDHHVGRTEPEVHTRIRERAEVEHVSEREALWKAYGETFPAPIRHAGYDDWIERVEEPHRARIDSELPARLSALDDGPLISVLLPVYDPSLAHLEQCLASVQSQSYPRWELCIVDDGSRQTRVTQMLDDAAANDERVRVRHRDDNGGISAASHDALAMASGPWVALLDHDDKLAPHALLQVAEAIAGNPTAKLIYGDEDKLSEAGEREQPHFKPRFDPDLLLGQNYLGHLACARTSLLREAGGFRLGYEGSQDHDLWLRATEPLDEGQVLHVPWILYHWRMAPHSTAAREDAKPRSAEAGIRAVRDALERRGLPAEVEHAEVAHCYRVTPALPDPAPTVTVIVPTRDAFSLVSRCLDTLLAATAYPRFEVVVVDNGTTEADAKRYLEQVADDPRVRILRDDRPFNFSALNNRAVHESDSDLVCLLNNDTEIVDPHWLRHLAAQAIRPAIGCAGAKLLYPDGTLQHAGVLLGLHGLAGHPYRLLSAHHPGYFGRLTVPHAVSAVTAACLVVQRDLYHQVGGFDEDLAVAFNDVDFCIKIREAGYRNLYVPQAVVTHHESATRGLDQDPEKRRRFLGEVDRVKKRWGSLIYDDPCYSPHLSLDFDDYSLRLTG